MLGEKKCKIENGFQGVSLGGFLGQSPKRVWAAPILQYACSINDKIALTRQLDYSEKTMVCVPRVWLFVRSEFRYCRVGEPTSRRVVALSIES